MSGKTKQTKPKWFQGVWHETGETVTNPFSGESYKLTGPELSMYDFIMGSQMVFEMLPKTATNKQIDDFHKALSWFRKHNRKAYKVLLDDPTPI